MSVPLASTRGFSLRRRMLPALSCSLALLCGASTRGAAQAQTVLTNCTEAALRDAVAAGGRARFACSGTITLDGTILITTNVMLDANGFQVTVSGAGMVRVFQVQTNVTFTVNAITISHGRERAGGGLLNQGGMVNLLNTVLLSNSAYCNGGGILNDCGTVNATNCVFGGNRAGGGGCSAQGAAICSLGGTVNLDRCVFDENTATGVVGSPGISGQDGSGGAVYNLGTLRVFACTFVRNLAAGGRGPDPWGINGGGSGGDGSGGAICNAGALQIQSSTFASNSVAGGAGAYGGQGAGGIYPDGTIGQPGNPGGLVSEGFAVLEAWTWLTALVPTTRLPAGLAARAEQVAPGTEHRRARQARPPVTVWRSAACPAEWSTTCWLAMCPSTQAGEPATITLAPT